MRAITFDAPGGPEVLHLAELADPVPAQGELLVDVRATAVNRADLLQRQGFYAPPPGSTDVLGLECAGVVVETAGDVGDWQVGDAVCALLAGGGYAEQVAVPAAQCLPVPPGLSFVEAAALPETVCTVWNNVVMVAGLQAGETLLVHGGASGIGTTAIQIAKRLGARVVVTVGSAVKAQRCLGIGADVAVEYRERDFVPAVREATAGAGANVVLDIIGAKYLAQNVAALAADGRLVIIGLQGGTKAELDLGALMAKRATIVGTTLRGRPPEQKAEIVAAVRDCVWPWVAAGEIRPVIDRVLPIESAAEAHRVVGASEHVGKVVLSVRPDAGDAPNPQSRER